MKTKHLFAVLLLISAVFVGFSCSKDGYNNSSSSNSQGSSTISIGSTGFAPISLSISAGATVKWTNNDAANHTVVSDNGSFSSGTLTPGSSYSYNFSSAGTYTYHCGIHPETTGTVVVAMTSGGGY